MKILKVIHGYPPRYNAGSEVYSQMLCQHLAKQHTIEVFTRQENPFLPDYVINQERDSIDSNITVNIINIVSERHRYRYQHEACDKALSTVLTRFQPDIVHVGHLNHLSTSLIDVIHQHRIPILFTLHDYWLMCPRRQFMQRLGKTADDLWPICDGQADDKCAKHCYAGSTSGSITTFHEEIAYWTQWISNRMQHIRTMTSLIDHFIAPSRYLYQRFIDDFTIPADKMTYVDYGFDLSRFAFQRQRISGEPFTFGYIGTQIPAKGIQQLISAFGMLTGNCQLRLWGKETANTAGLKAIANKLPNEKMRKIQWCGEYINSHIVTEVFNRVDAIVVPSIWVENSPLVIHEALQAGVAVITADAGGMAEYIQHEINGLLFKHRDVASLAQQMQRFVDKPSLSTALAKRGYLFSATGEVVDMETHGKVIEAIYQQIILARSSKYVKSRTVADHI